MDAFNRPKISIKAGLRDMALLLAVPEGIGVLDNPHQQRLENVQLT